MVDARNTPEIRFDGFVDDWVPETLGAMVERLEYGLNAAAMTYDGTNKYLRITDIDDESREFLQTGLTSPNVNFGNADNYLLCEGDVLFARTGASVGKTYRYKLSDEKVYFAGFLIRARIKAEFASEFLFQSTLTSTYDKFVRLTSQRSGQPGINAQEYSDLMIMVPSKKEQAAIGNFFRNLDDTIALKKQQHEKTLNIKTAMLEKMFPKKGVNVPEIRFDGFSGAWEYFSWANSVDISTNMVDPKAGDYDDLPHIGPGNIESFTGQLYNNVKSVKEDRLISGKFHFLSGDIIYGKINPQLAKYIHANFEGLCSADAYVLNAKNGVEQEFLFRIIQLKEFYDYTVSVSQRSGMPKINRDELNQYSFLAPNSLEEQKAIGRFFRNLDSLIDSERQEIEKLHNIKKACLSKMFV